jgi:hypothetical protein
MAIQDQRRLGKATGRQGTPARQCNAEFGRPAALDAERPQVNCWQASGVSVGDLAAVVRRSDWDC